VKDWNEDYAKEDTDIKNIYHAEIDELLKKIYPEGNNVVAQSNGVIHRGRDTKTNKYGSGVHQDYGLTVEDFKE